MRSRLLLLVAAGALVAGCDPGTTPILRDSGTTRRDAGGPIECPPSQSFCNGRCIPTATNPLHCGACGNVCASDETCEGGSCRGAVTCPAGERDCGGGCTDVEANPMHCGRCGEECAEGESCISGACVPDSCPAEQPDRCEDRCTDVREDDANCGACGTKCAVDETCVSGSCTSSCAGTTCEVDGADVCVDTATDPMNCGACGTTCEDGESCSGGSCGCPSGTTECGGRCVDTATDPAHCGTCGMACDTGSACASGRCECPTGLTRCGASCVNTQINVSHCGGCESPCGSGESCVSGSCMTTCGAGLTQCGPACVDTADDDRNCGRCGNVCEDGLACNEGVCRPINDDREDATPLFFPSDGSEVVQRGTTDGATPDLPALSCAANGPNIWYRVTIPAGGGVLWADTSGSGYDTAVFVTDSSGTQVSGMCNDDCACFGDGDFGFLESCTARYVAAGDYYISVGGYSISQTGDFTLHVQFLPDTGFTYRTRLNASGTTFRTFLLDTSEASATCGGSRTAISGEDMRWFTSCGGTDPHHFSVCPEDGGLWTRNGTRPGDEGETYDPVLSVRSGLTGTETACNDDGGSAFNCAPEGGGPNFGSRLRDLTPGRGIHGVLIDCRTLDGGGMEYRMRYEIPDLDF